MRNENYWLVIGAYEGGDLINEIYELLKKDRAGISPLLETTGDFQEALNYLKQWECNDIDKTYEPRNIVVRYFRNFDETDDYIIGETPMGDVLLFTKNEGE